MGLFIKKPFEALLAEANVSGSKSLKRVLGPWSLVALGVGVIIGAGLFSITGTVAAGYTGPAITLSFAIAALGCCFAGLCYAEFASMIPVAGSAYTYSYATMGELIAWIIGWDLVLEYTVAATTVSISWSRYLVVFLEGLDIHLPPALTACPWDGGIVNIPAFLIVVLMSIFLIRGTEGSSIFNGIIVFLKVSVVLVFVHWAGNISMPTTILHTSPPIQVHLANTVSRVSCVEPPSFSLLSWDSMPSVRLHRKQKIRNGICRSVSWYHSLYVPYFICCLPT